MIGHPLDVEMFNASQWHMHESKEGSIFSSTHSSSSSPSSIGGAMELRVIKAFPFVHSLRRMSVIVKSSLDNSISLFTKARRPSPSRSLAAAADFAPHRARLKRYATSHCPKRVRLPQR
jgi:magnesium-transporting ATPase (P-type)